ncbi:MAG: DEAD/DEAH box helicase family protein [Burkholderiales bacterium]|nr:DEAD/DEAH box helicase family protein [Burkholderiales bacterium]
MTTPFQQLLSIYRDNSETQREKGNYFEKLVIPFLQNDARFAPQFSKIQTFSEWAKKQNKSGFDSGIDLVATNSAEYGEGYTAIQCKFYNTTSISKAEIDSFMAASDSSEFTRRLLIDTTDKGLNKVVEEQLNNSSKEFTRISLDEFETSSIDWEFYLQQKIIKEVTKKSLRPHQLEALNATKKGFTIADRGKLFMACGTGKTFTALKIAESCAGKNKRVLFLVPSLALASQTITEWSIETTTPIHAFAVCSDVDVGKRKASEDDIAEVNTHDLAYPATTDAKKLAEKNQQQYPDKMTVIFSTYQSIDVINKAQKLYGMADFDLIICDEAHRTTGATLAGEDDSEFVKIHDNDFIRGTKRLYMTATPRIYIDTVKEKAKENKAELYSMDDTEVFGTVFYSLKFGEAVEKGLLTDYKVIVLAIDAKQVSSDMQKYFKSSGGGLDLDDVAKMIGCYKALIKEGLQVNDHKPMQRAVSFCKSIAASKDFSKEFGLVVDEYLAIHPEIGNITCQLDHVDGTMNATEKGKKLSWLKENTEDTCRILSNAKCLSEGVDVPSLDAVMFIHGRKSKVDIVQSVGRVMRKAPNKQLGYIIIPVVIPEGKSSEEELKKNPSYQIVWDVLNALRSHDERLDSDINKVELVDSLKSKIEAIQKHVEIVAMVDKLPEYTKQSQGKKSGMGTGGDSKTSNGDNDRERDTPQQAELDLSIDTVQKAMLAKIVEKCGTRTYWEDWANDITDIASKHILRIKTTLEDKSSLEYQTFIEFVQELKNNLNDSITEEEVIEMLAQHIITRPVFNALFSDYNFADNNSISRSMQKVIDLLDAHHIDNEAKKLDKFYASVKRRADGIDNAEAKQKIIVELYDKFFRNAFPRMTERLGIVYTPVECVDFIIHSVNDILKQEFNQELGDRNTHIIDPFTGTGTFITRLMQSGLLTKEQLEYKYNLQDKTVNGEKIKTTELHANEIVLLAYYIASINIEAVYHAIVGGKYQPFEGICLTDTFQLNEKSEDLITPQLADNNHRRKTQKKLPIRVFIGNPPYSAGQSNANDNNQNLEYLKLDSSIESTYVKYSNAALSKSAYDSYIRAIRWASDRIDKYGVIGFITNNGWIYKSTTDGMRKCIVDEFSSTYIFDLKGAIRGKSGDVAKKEGQNVFDIMTGVAITIFVKNPEAKEQGKIYYHDIGNYLNRQEKLEKIINFNSIESITQQGLWQEITPDKYNDWLNQRDDGFYDYISLGDKKDKASATLFENYSQGILTSRDAWLYNASKVKLTQNISNMIDFYTSELERYKVSDFIKNQPTKSIEAEKYVAGFVNNDSKKIAWSGNLKDDFAKKKVHQFKHCLVKSTYRAFSTQWLYYDTNLTARVYQMPKIIPERGVDNLILGTSGIGARTRFSILCSNNIIDYQTLDNGQSFPLYLYEPKEESTNGFDFSDDSDVVTAPSGTQYTRKEAITDAGLKHFTDFYSDASITKEDLFYYIYGLLHSEEYKTKYADNLTKALPRIPRVKTIADFRAFEQAGRKLADLHLNYENKELYPVTFTKDISQLQANDYRVIKMKFASKADKSKIIYNGKITLENIPLEAYDYVVNGKSAIEWVMERQGVSTHKDSGIINDANDWAIETMNNPRYPLELLQRVITVSLETVKIVNNLPKLDI